MTHMQKPGLLIIFLVFVSAAHAQTKNDFDLSDASVPADQIRRGGVPRDGIPSIDNPKFVTAENADFLWDRDRVLGVFRNDIAKAHP